MKVSEIELEYTCILPLYQDACKLGKIHKKIQNFSYMENLHVHLLPDQTYYPGINFCHNKNYKYYLH